MSTPAASFTIRPARITDLSAIVSIYNQAILTRQATADLVPIAVQQRQDWFAAHGLAQNRPILVAISNQNELLGWAALSDFHDRPAYQITAEASVYVDGAWQGQGVGRALLQELLAYAQAGQVQQVIALIFEHNQASLGLFGRCGFSVWGRLPDVCDLDGMLASVMILGKRLVAG